VISDINFGSETLFNCKQPLKIPLPKYTESVEFSKITDVKLKQSLNAKSLTDEIEEGIIISSILDPEKLIDPIDDTLFGSAIASSFEH
jgi:hypothetical protein